PAQSPEKLRNEEELAPGAVRGSEMQPRCGGARVYVYVGDRRISGEIQSGSSFLSQNDPRLHFGLADDASYKRIEVQWPGGAREVFEGGAANRIVVLKQNTGSRLVLVQPEMHAFAFHPGYRKNPR